MKNYDVLKLVKEAITTVEREFLITRDEVVVIDRLKDEINRRVIGYVGREKAKSDS